MARVTGPVLQGKSFGFYGFLSSERQRIQSKITNFGGRVVQWNAKLPDSALASVRVLYVITNYWVSSLPDHYGTNLRMVPAVHVTEFWLDDVIAKGSLLPIEAHEYYTPPDGNVELCYPLEYHDLGLARHHVLLPCSPHNLHEQQVPLWPYIAWYLSKPMRKQEELTAVLMRISGRSSSSSFESLTTTFQRVFTDSERRKFFKETLPVMAKAALEVAYEFPSSLPLLVSLNDSPADHFSRRLPSASSSTAVSGAKQRFSTHFHTRSCHITRRQAFCLLSHCFFGSFPPQNESFAESKESADSEKVSNAHQPRWFPEFNMIQLFVQRKDHSAQIETVKQQKLRTILQYFLRLAPAIQAVADEIPVISYTRIAMSFEETGTENTNVDDKVKLNRKHREPLGQYIPLVVNADTAVELLKQARIPTPESTVDVGPRLQTAQIETKELIEALDGHIQVNFANAFAGGGVLEYGFVQEEIRFSIFPELLVACAIFERLHPNEVFLVTGAEQFSHYEGYGSTFRFGGNFADSTSFCPFADTNKLLWSRRESTNSTRYVQRQSVTVGMDASDYRRRKTTEQFSRLHVWRELVKCFTGFSLPVSSSACAWPIATGNWGGGAFCGDMELKFLIQWIAACLHGKKMKYVVVDAQRQEHQSFLKRVAKLNELYCGGDDSDSTAAKSHENLRQLVQFLFELEDFTQFVSSDISVLDLASQQFRLSQSAS